ncbi:hypothetical protein SeLEV6574_g06288 [Synchytrium endobioticum]|uniref:Choline/carnitine acyltransferase domain-containing protein n=1 Tax=Synchytrium endobioticum TaxID=286115 RepID=A0A507CPI2_9FUNG|nr:hypothetical protein SeLEV6574_g06288 [Synchytrium endobioticum]
MMIEYLITDLNGLKNTCSRMTLLQTLVLILCLCCRIQPVATDDELSSYIASMEESQIAMLNKAAIAEESGWRLSTARALFVSSDSEFDHLEDTILLRYPYRPCHFNQVSNLAMTPGFLELASRFHSLALAHYNLIAVELRTVIRKNTERLSSYLTLLWLNKRLTSAVTRMETHLWFLSHYGHALDGNLQQSSRTNWRKDYHQWWERRKLHHDFAKTQYQSLVRAARDKFRAQNFVGKYDPDMTMIILDRQMYPDTQITTLPQPRMPIGKLICLVEIHRRNVETWKRRCDKLSPEWVGSHSSLQDSTYWSDQYHEAVQTYEDHQTIFYKSLLAIINRGRAEQYRVRWRPSESSHEGNRILYGQTTKAEDHSNVVDARLDSGAAIDRPLDTVDTKSAEGRPGTPEIMNHDELSLSQGVSSAVVFEEQNRDTPSIHVDDASMSPDVGNDNQNEVEPAENCPDATSWSRRSYAEVVRFAPFKITDDGPSFPVEDSLGSSHSALVGESSGYSEMMRVNNEGVSMTLKNKEANERVDATSPTRLSFADIVRSDTYGKENKGYLLLDCSQVKNILGTGFGAVCVDGYGINYTVAPKVIKYGIESKCSCQQTSSIGFKDALAQAFKDMAALCEREVKL